MTLADIVRQLLGLINIAVAMLITAALVIFLWGALRFMFRAGDAHGRSADKDMLIYGLVAMFVLVSVFGIVKILQQALLL